MRSFYALVLLFFCLLTNVVHAQTSTISTTFTNNNGNGQVTFNFQNTNGYPVRITEIASVTSSTGSIPVQAWYRTTPINSATAPPAVTTANGWTQFGSATITAVANSTTTTPQTFMTGLDLVVPAGATYGIVVGATNLRYSSLAAGTYTESSGGCSIITGTNIGWAGGAIPANFANNERGFIGTVTFESVGPCTSPPNTGTISSTQNPACSGSNFTLTLVGGTGGTGQTYQWQSSTDDATWSNIAGATTATLTTSQTASTYYRAIVTCGTAVTSSSVQITTPALVSGNFTINSGLPTGGGVFQTFTEAINHIKCGISGPVTFTVEPGSGPYNERVVIPQIGGASATNKVTFIGNGATILHNTSDGNNRTAVTFNGADHIVLDSLVVDASSGTFGWGIVLTGQADSNIIRNCTIVTNKSSTSTNYMGILINGSTTATGSSGNNANGNLIANNTIDGGYHGIYLYGSTTPYNQNNIVAGNRVLDFYNYGIYFYGNNNITISGNDISRPTRTAVTSTYSIYISTNTNALVEKNKIHNLFDAATGSTSLCYGIYVIASGLSAAQPNRIENNLLYNFNNGAGTQAGIYALGYNNYNYYHNTVVLDDAASTAGTTYGMYVYGTATNVKNNIVIVSRGGTGTKYTMYYSTTGVTTSNNNVLQMLSTTGTTNVLVNRSSVNYTTLAGWQASNSNAFDQQSVDVDPMFLNPSAGEYIPQSPTLNNLGANVGVATDIDNKPRTVASPDPGAYEFNLGSCTYPLTPGTVVAPTTVCANTPFILTLDNSSTGDGLTYQWQSSTDNVTWTNLATPSTAISFQASQASATWYRAALQCGTGAIVHTASVQVASPALVSGTYTINSGLPTGSGNFQNFADAINHVACGINGPVVFDVAPGSGPYMDQVVIPQIKGASPVNTITFNGNGATITYSPTDGSLRSAILLNGSDHVIIDSFIVDVSNGTFGWGISLAGQADSNTIRNCKIINNTTSTSTNYMGIILNGSATSTASSGNNANGNLVTGNTITGGYYGIYAYGSTAPYNKRNIFSNNKVEDFYSYGIYTYGQDSIIISGNDISRPARTAVTSAYGIYPASCTNFLVEKNSIHNLFDGAPSSTSSSYPIYVASTGLAASPNRIENNIVYNLNNGAGLIYGLYGSSYNYNNYYHNTVVIDDASATAGTTYGLLVSGTGVNVRNNIVIISRGGTGAKYNLYYSTTGVTSSNNNILINTSTGGTTNAIAYHSTGFNTLAAWQAANSNNDPQSLEIDPAFANAAGGDFTPTNSLANNKGAAVGVLTDFYDSTRSTTTPDIGAIEFSTLTAGNNMSAEQLVTPTAKASGCYTASEQVTVRIRNSSLSAIDFAVTPVTITVEVSGATNQYFTHTLNTGTMQSDATMDVLMPQLLDMSAAGTYTFAAATSVANDANPSNDAIVPVVRTKQQLTAGTAVSAPDSYCAQSSIMPMLKTSGAAGYNNLQWLQSTSATGGWSTIPGATGTTYQLATAPTQTMYYKLSSTCGTSVDTSAMIMLEYNNPTITSTTPAARCGAGNVTMSAAGSASNINWYRTATGGAPIYTGNSFTTAISSDTTFYVAAGQGGGSEYVGPADIAIGASISVNYNYYLTFDVLQPTTIVSVDIFPTDAIGTSASIQITNSTGTVLYTIPYTTTVTGGNKQTVVLNQTMTPGSYRMQQGGTHINLHRNSTGASFPYTSSAVSITGHSFSFASNPTFYYYFYNWQVSSGCESARMPITASITDCPVPVNLYSFKGEKQASTNRLEWTTLTEANNAGFELQRSADGTNFSALAFAESKAANGFSNRPLTYSYNDVRPLATNNYYRLKQMDKDGKVTFSQIVLLKGAKVNAVTISNIYPNPVKNDLNVVIASPATEKIQLVVTDVTGKVMANAAYQLQAGDNVIKLDVERYSTGTYIIKATCANGCDIASFKFIKQ
ncbi:right-handed parallel beta-helix repeat-containing protein [Aridibaculum aurantiacum]|uniref:right-handed parallel beta-helix repeat-containing protein n=1 Tax=Aridibaculum aurantiacum TaxID=2810307 RepID=UPI001A958C00|nr:right-handed parallel beta-helix repeat-containing protein [Aridibaculum aurantiacum]